MINFSIEMIPEVSFRSVCDGSTRVFFVFESVTFLVSVLLRRTFMATREAGTLLLGRIDCELFKMWSLRRYCASGDVVICE